ncbi:SGNH/GDSL hydrolase family protein [Paenibacillus taichungensis]|uniref:SGNH/GDSL hydrolase family protein n=1 Tax=Paenibacillus taichungensis TaxID=484184 RepID=UPI0039A40681
MSDRGFKLAAAASGELQDEKLRRGYLFNAEIGLAKWRSALAKALNGDVLSTLCVYGSSSVVGQGSGGGGIAGTLTYGKNKLDKGFVGRLRTAIAKQCGDVGSGLIPHWYTWWYTFAGTWADSGVGGILNLPSKRGESVGATCTVTFTGTSFSVIGIESAEGGKFTISIDGGAAQEFNSNGASEAAKEYKYSGTLTSASHTAVITVTELVAGKDRSGLALIGVMYGGASTTGVKVHQIGYAGGKTDQIGNNRALYRPTTIDFWKPNLSLICFSSNDYSSQTPLATFRTQTQTAITQAKQFGDVLLVPVGITAPDKAIPITEYSKIYKELALLNSCAYYDTYARYQDSFTTARDVLQFMASDNTHMNDYGHQDLASGLYNALMNY